MSRLFSIAIMIAFSMDNFAECAWLWWRFRPSGISQSSESREGERASSSCILFASDF